MLDTNHNLVQLNMNNLGFCCQGFSNPFGNFVQPDVNCLHPGGVSESEPLGSSDPGPARLLVHDQNGGQRRSTIWDSHIRLGDTMQDAPGSKAILI